MLDAALVLAITQLDAGKVSQPLVILFTYSFITIFLHYSLGFGVWRCLSQMAEPGPTNKQCYPFGMVVISTTTMNVI
jgi:hypothetical protein